MEDRTAYKAQENKQPHGNWHDQRGEQKKSSRRVVDQEPIVQKLAYSNLGTQVKLLAMIRIGLLLDVSSSRHLLRSYKSAINTNSQSRHD
jgi:hypothetical protein